MLKANPDVKYFGLLLYAGHGMIRDGVQCFVLNQLNKSQGYYYLQAVETDIRNISMHCKNSYILATFACCREIFVKTMHCNCVWAKDKIEAEQIFADKDAEK